MAEGKIGRQQGQVDHGTDRNLATTEVKEVIIDVGNGKFILMNDIGDHGVTRTKVRSHPVSVCKFVPTLGRTPRHLGQ